MTKKKTDSFIITQQDLIDEVLEMNKRLQNVSWKIDLFLTTSEGVVIAKSDGTMHRCKLGPVDHQL